MPLSLKRVPEFVITVMLWMKSIGTFASSKVTDRMLSTRQSAGYGITTQVLASDESDLSCPHVWSYGVGPSSFTHCALNLKIKSACCRDTRSKVMLNDIQPPISHLHMCVVCIPVHLKFCKLAQYSVFFNLFFQNVQLPLLLTFTMVY